MSVSRRDFALLALTAGAAASIPAAADTPASSPVGETSAPVAAHAEAEARIAMILGRYGTRFTEAQKADIRRLITGAQESLDAMRAYPLDNAIEPATTFRVLRGSSRPKKVGVH